LLEDIQYFNGPHFSNKTFFTKSKLWEKNKSKSKNKVGETTP